MDPPSLRWRCRLLRNAKRTFIRAYSRAFAAVAASPLASGSQPIFNRMSPWLLTAFWCLSPNE